MAKDIIPQSVRWATLLIGVLNFGEPLHLGAGTQAALRLLYRAAAVTPMPRLLTDMLADAV